LKNCSLLKNEKKLHVGLTIFESQPHSGLMLFNNNVPVVHKQGIIVAYLKFASVKARYLSEIKVHYAENDLVMRLRVRPLLAYIKLSFVFLSIFRTPLTEVGDRESAKLCHMF